MTGKSTMFRLPTGVEPSPHATPGEAQAGVARVADPRLDRLTEMYNPKKKVAASVEYLDLAGVEKGQAATALPLDQLRTADALAHVVRGFEDEALPHSEGEIDPARDVATMETEFILADHGIAEKRLEKLRLQVMKANKDEDKKELAVIEKCVEQLEQEIPLRNVEFDDAERLRLRGFTFLSLKPLLVAVNADESDASRLAGSGEAFGLAALADRPNVEVVAFSAKIEAEIAELSAEDASGFMADLGIEQPALDRMIRASYRLLGSMSFFTVGEDECRAWSIPRGTPARRAAGAIHSDIEKGFIRAETGAAADLLEAGSLAALREKAGLRLEGKEYEVQDGDVINFRFNV